MADSYYVYRIWRCKYLILMIIGVGSPCALLVSGNVPIVVVLVSKLEYPPHQVD